MGSKGEEMGQCRTEVVIYAEDCKSCGLCIDLCPTHVLAYKRPLLKPIVVDIDACTACRLCELICPDWAISVEKEDSRVGNR